jgi:hypothetical protein
MNRRADVVSLVVMRRSLIWYLIDTPRPQWKDILRFPQRPTPTTSNPTDRSNATTLPDNSNQPPQMIQIIHQSSG